MAVPTGTASLLDIQNEFGGGGQIAISEYYGVISSVPASGQISINDFRGKYGAVAPIWTAGSNSSINTTTGPAVAFCTLWQNGIIDLAGFGTDGTWLPSGASSSDYEAKWVRSSGDTVSFSTGWTENTYLPLSSNREVYVTDSLSTFQGSKFSIVQITIRSILDTSLSVVQSVALDAEYESGPDF